MNSEQDLDPRIQKLIDESKRGHAGIWLEVAEVQFEKGEEPLRVQLKGDRAHPRPVWWTVGQEAVEPGTDFRHTYREILREMDRKRAVLARLTWALAEKPIRLHCDALRFQSAELGSR